MCDEPMPKHVNLNQTSAFLSNRFGKKVNLVAENALPRKRHMAVTVWYTSSKTYISYIITTQKQKIT
jgi:hypothetical protein